MNAPLYTTEILRLAASLDAPPELDRVDGEAEVRSPTCGSRVATSVQVENGQIEALSQQVHACAFGQASAALLQRSAVGRRRDNVEQALAELGDWLVGADVALSWPGLDALAPARPRAGRHGAILLPFRALLAAFEDVR